MCMGFFFFLLLEHWILVHEDPMMFGMRSTGNIADWNDHPSA